MTSPLEKVSVVIPVYNGEHFVATAIESALAQTHSNMEIVAVNDGSADCSLDVLRRFAGRITIVDQKNSGVANARNAGIQNSTGDFIAFLDQDDWWLPAKIEKQLEVLRSYECVGLVHTAVRHFSESTDEELPPLNPHARPAEMVGDCSRKLLLGNPIYNSSVLVRRSVLEHVGNCDAEMAGNTVADYDLWLRIAKWYQFGFVNDALTCYRMHDQQGILDRRAMLTAELKVLLRIQDERCWLQDPEFRTRLAILYDALAVAWFDCGEYATARRYFTDSLRVAKSTRAFKRWAASRLPAFVVERLRG